MEEQNQLCVGYNISMNFFSRAGDIAQGMMNYMNNNENWSAGNQKENNLRKNLQNCTYPDETKYMIEKAVKQVFHVYPFFNAEIIMFTEGGFQRRYLELKGIIQIDIKGKTCKVDFNMMLPSDFPRSSPFVRIINRNPDYKVDQFYQTLQSKSDKSSFILNEKLNTCKNWHPSNSLVNVIIECYDMLKTRFPFSKPVQENMYGSGGKSNPWDAIYQNNGNNGGGFNNNWGQPSGPQTSYNAWGANNQQNWPNNWGNTTGGWGAKSPMGGMGGIMTSGGGFGNGNVTSNIASGQKYVGKQKQTLNQINAMFIKVLEKNQILDATRQSLEIEQSTLRRENFQMANFLKQSEQQGSILDLTSFVKPANEASEQVLDLLSSVKAREECIMLLENRFNQEQLSLQEFMKQARKLQELRFEQKVLLNKCIKHAG